MDGNRCDDWARWLATGAASRRTTLRLLVGGVLVGAALGPGDAAAACRQPKKPYTKGKQCCTKKCKHGKCAACANGAPLLLAPDQLCWLTWGSNGSGDGQFNAPWGVALSGNGHIYASDYTNHRIVRVQPR
jgi:hypothetical protein